jgi:hypothetical protein
MSERACAVLLKASPKAKVWEFISYTLREEVAWRSAAILLESERAGGSPNARVAVVLREDYDEGRIKPLKAPKGFGELERKLRTGIPPVTDCGEVCPNVVKPTVKRVKTGAFSSGQLKVELSRKLSSTGRLLEEI